MKNILLTLLLVLSLCAENNETTMQKKEISFYDKDDGMLDASEFLSETYGFLPVPVLITEPAIGYGGGLGLVYFHDKFLGNKSASGRSIPTSITALFAMATENGTKAGGLAHMGYYLEDRLRTVTFAIYSDINVDTYINDDIPIAANMNGPVFYQAVKYRIKETGLFLGAGFVYSDLENSLNDGSVTLPKPGLPPSNITIPTLSSDKMAAAQLIAEYDTRDNTLSPTSGYFLNFKANFFDEALGGDMDFQRYMLKSFFYLPVTSKLNINFNIGADTMANTDENTPFYAYPFINLRGLPVMGVQGEHALATELEVCWSFTPRWEGLVFGGAGTVFGTSQIAKYNEATGYDQSFGDAHVYPTGGVGFRYLVAKKFGLKVGVDIATSELDDAFYIQVGSAWAGI